MNSHQRTRRATLLGVPALAALASGCVGTAPPPPTWYVMNDAASDTASAAGPKIDQVLLLGPVDASPFDSSVMLVYGRSPGTRAYYQFAGWTERPARRLGVLAERRRDARGRFRAVAQSTSGLRGDLLLNLSLEHLYHDVSTSPGRARLAVVAELVAWKDHALVARRRFNRDVEVEREAADAAVAAMNRGVTALLDDLCAWAEAQAAQARPAASGRSTG